MSGLWFLTFIDPEDDEAIILEFRGDWNQAREYVLFVVSSGLIFLEEFTVLSIDN